MKFSRAVKVFTCYLLSEEKEPTHKPIYDVGSRKPMILVVG